MHPTGGGVVFGLNVWVLLNYISAVVVSKRSIAMEGGKARVREYTNGQCHKGLATKYKYTG